MFSKRRAATTGLWKGFFSGLRPDAQGKLLLSFVPLKDYACVYAIEVTDEAR